jgi:5-methylcytosine-specific restriction endonuclease McrA
MGKREDKAKRIFTKRTSSIFHGQKRRAKQYDETLDYDLKEMRALTASALNRPCPYCGIEITPYNLSLDHQNPTSRGGEHALHNLAVSCERCNQIKGNMTAEEFHLLMQVIREMPPVANRSVFARLRAGGKLIHN